MKTKAISLLLVLLMTACVFASCRENGEAGETQTDITSEQIQTQTNGSDETEQTAPPEESTECSERCSCLKKNEPQTKALGEKHKAS